MESLPADKELTYQEEKFVHEYFLCMCNPAIAAQKTKYTRGASFKMLQQPHIQRYIEEVRNDIGKKLGITRERVALELAKVAFFNIKNIFNSETGNLKSIREIDDDTAAAISGVEVESIGKDDQPFQLLRSKYKIHNKVDALLAINKMLGYDEPPKQQLPLGPDGQPLTTMPTINVQINNNHIPPREDLDGE